MSDRSPATLFIGNCKISTDELKKTLKEYEFKVQKAFCTKAETAIVSFNSPLEAQQCLSLIQQKTLFKGCTADFARKQGRKRPDEEVRPAKKAKIEEDVTFAEDKTKDEEIVKKLEKEEEVDEELEAKKAAKKEKMKKRRGERLVKREERQAKELVVPKNENRIVFDDNMDVDEIEKVIVKEAEPKKVAAPIEAVEKVVVEVKPQVGEFVNDAPVELELEDGPNPRLIGPDGEIDYYAPTHARFAGMDDKKIRKQIKHEKSIIRRQYRKEAKQRKRDEEAAKPKPVLPPKNKAKYDFADRFVRKEMAQKRQKYPDPEEGTTLFIKYVPANANKTNLENLFKKFGPLHYVTVTGESAFVNFKDKSIADDCLKKYNETRDADIQNKNKDSILMEFNNENEFSLNGYVLDVVKAKSKEDLSNLMRNKQPTKVKSNRRLDALGEGLHLSEDASKYLSEDNLQERLELLKQAKDICAKDNEMQVSDTRVHLRNIPKDWDEHKLQIIVRAVMAKVILQTVDKDMKDYDLIKKSLNDLTEVVNRKVPWFSDWMTILVEHYLPTLEFKSELTLKLKKHFTNPMVPKKSRQNYKMRIPGFNCLYNQMTIKKDLDGESKKFGFISFKDEYGAELAVKILTLLPVDKESGAKFVDFLKSGKGGCRNTMIVSYALNNRKIIEIREQRKVQAKIDKREEKLKKFAPQIEQKRKELAMEEQRDFGKRR